MYQSWRRVHGRTQMSGAGFIVPAAGAGVDIGFNFRGTSGYVTDGANQVYVLSTDTYPTTRGGFTFGWVQTGTKTPNAADRNSGVDVRLAGINYVEDYLATTMTYFRVDLTAGTYNFRVAAGDASFSGQTNQNMIFQDTTTSRFAVTSASALAAGHFLDAQSVDYDTATWPGSNTPQTGVSISTGQLRIVMGDGSGVSTQVLAHVRIYS